MKILQFIETGGPGGAEQVVLKLSENLINNGYEIITGTFREGWLTQNLDKKNIPRKLFNSYNNAFSLISYLLKMLEDEKIDLVHSHLLDSNFYFSIACRIKKIPHIATEHGDIHHIDIKKFGYLKCKTISYLSNEIIAVSEYTKNALVNKGVSASKITVIPNSFDFEDNSISDKNYKTEMLKKLLPGLSPSAPEWIWINVANIREVKDQSTLLEGYALSRTRHKIPQKILIAGDGELRQKLKEKARDLNIEKDVIFLGFRDDIKQLLSVCNGFILSSVSEAMPISLLEAAENKLLIISTNTGGIPEIITDMESGLLFPVKDPGSLAEKIDYAVLNQRKSQEIAAHAYEKIKSICSSKNTLRRILDIYNQFKIEKKI